MPNPAITLSVPKAALKANLRSRSALDKLVREATGKTLQVVLNAAVEDAIFDRRSRKLRPSLTTHTTP